MPHFYFHVTNSTGLVRDEEGRELAEIDAAREQALEDIRSILSEEVKRGVLDLQGRLEVADSSGNVIVSIPFKEAVELRLDETPPPNDGLRKGA